MDGIIRALSLNDEDIQINALQTLQEVPSIAYIYIDEFIPKIGAETLRLLQGSDYEVTRQIISFWTNLTKEE